MNPLKIEQTNVSPLVNFNPTLGIYVMAGYSRPENVRDFYMPIIDWLSEFKDSLCQSKNKGEMLSHIDFDFKFIYFNSSSAKFLYDIVIILNEMQKLSLPISINWHFDKEDDELREAGEELSDMAQVPFKFIEIN
ncbi:MAG: DUF1987 domain-containing protein [Bacteroidales bacterium]|nr:DUF1987 domain-containing protein [Bacteroidales bacterium]